MTTAKASAPRLKTHYKSVVVPEMVKRCNFKNPFQVPRILKIVVNMGVNDAKEDIKALDVATEELSVIVGQRPQVRRAKKSISNFKLRQGLPIGARVTLRHHRMYEFIDRFINVAVPRIRDFRGFSDKSFDGRGNYTIGLKEHIIFPEIDVDKVTKVFGMDITFVTTAWTDQEAYELLRGFGMPFVKREEPMMKSRS